MQWWQAQAAAVAADVPVQKHDDNESLQRRANAPAVPATGYSFSCVMATDVAELPLLTAVQPM
jgi:hypothetical protein